MSQRSPFARRVRLALDRVGIPVDEEVVADVLKNPPARLLEANPLGLLPTLVGPGGFVLSDSAMILEWAHAQTGKVFPSGSREWAVRQAVVLAAGVIQATVQYFLETKMHEAPSPWWANDHAAAIRDTLQTMENLSPGLLAEGEDLTQAGWDLAVALEYLTIRMPEYNWKSRHAGFQRLVELAHRNPKFDSTVPQL